MKSRTYLNSYDNTVITLIPKPDKDISIKKQNIQTNIPYGYRHKNPQQKTSKWIQQHINRAVHLCQVWLILGIQGWFNMWKSINAIHYTNKELKPHDYSVDAEKAFDEVQYTLAW